MKQIFHERLSVLPTSSDEMPDVSGRLELNKLPPGALRRLVAFTVLSGRPGEETFWKEH